MELVEQGNWLVSLSADTEGFYHLFDTTDTSSFSHYRLKVDDITALGNLDRERSMAGLIGALNQERGINEHLLNGQAIRVDYLAPTAVQKSSIKVCAITQDHLQVLDDLSIDELWNDVSDVVAKAVLSGSSGQLVPYSPPIAAEDSLREYTYEHRCRGELYGVEKAQMHPMVQSFIEVTHGEIQSLESHLAAIANGDPEFGKLITQYRLDLNARGPKDFLCLASREAMGGHNPEANLLLYQLEYLKSTFDKARDFQKGGATLIDSNYYRDLLGEAFTEKCREWNKSFSRKEWKKADLTLEQWEAVHERAAQKYIPFLVNCWKQTAQAFSPASSQVKGSDPLASWMRLGAAYDFRSALVGLDNLIDPVSGLDISSDKLTQRVRAIIAELIQNPPSFGDKKDPQVVSSAYAAINAVLKQVGVYNTPPVYRDGLLVLETDSHGQPEIDIEGVLKWIGEKRAIAQTQFLSLLQGQVGELKAGDTELKWLHMNLLKPHENKIENLGWTHSEREESRDIKWMFDHFRGAEILFGDVSSPRIEYDDKGKPTKITLGRHLVEAAPTQPIKLHTYCLSNSVASGGLHREGDRDEKAASDQKILNKAFFDEVVDAAGGIGWAGTYDYLDASAQERMARLKEGHSDFYSAEEMAFELIKRGWLFSTGCQSGKDRTGYVCSRLAQRLVVSRLDEAYKREEIGKFHYTAVRYALNQRPFDSDRVSQQILQANTGASNIKVGVLDLPGDDFLYLRRLRHYSGLAIEHLIKPKAIQKIAIKIFNA